MEKIQRNTEIIQDIFGIRVINATPHPIRFKHPDTGEEVVIPPSGFVVNAKPEEEVVEDRGAYRLVRTRFVGDPKVREVLESLKSEGVLVVGSIIAAQAYPGLVVAMTPHPDFVRVPPAEKRMDPTKFTVFTE